MKTFKQFLAEMPQRNSYWSKDVMKPAIDSLVSSLKSGAAEVSPWIHHKVDNEGNHLYASKKGNSTLSVHSITPNHQQAIAGKVDGSAKSVHSVMIHHAKTYGRITSWSGNSKGGENLWINLVKSEPKNMKFHYTTQKNDMDAPKVVHELSKNNIDHHREDIWGKGMDKTGTLIHMVYHRD